MKLAGVAILAVMTTEALGANQGVLVSKSNATGFVMPAYARSERCDVYVDKVVITVAYGRGDDGGFTLGETRPVRIAGGIHQAIDAAARALLAERTNGLCDGPSTRVVAFRQLAGDQVESVTLFGTGGCGANRQEREGGSAATLRALVDRYCPETHDVGAGPR